MQILLKKTSNIFERLEHICSERGIRGITELSEKLGYSSPEKLYRLGRKDKKTGKFGEPSFEIIRDIANMFEDLNIRWLLLGQGEVWKETSLSIAAEPEISYNKTSNENLELKIEIRVLKETIREMIQHTTKKKSHEKLDC